MTHQQQFYYEKLQEAIKRREEAREAGDYKAFSLAEIDVSNYQTMLERAKA